MESFLLVVTGHLPKRSAACQVVPRLQPNELLTVGWNHSSKFFLWKWIPFYWFKEILPPPVTRLYMKWKLMNCVLDSRNSYISSICFANFPWLHIDSNIFQFRPWLLQSWVDVLDPMKQPTEDVFDGHQVGSSSNGQQKRVADVQVNIFCFNKQKGSQNDVEIQIDSHEASIISRFGVLVAKLENGDVHSYASLPEDKWKSFRWCLFDCSHESRKETPQLPSPVWEWPWIFLAKCQYFISSYLRTSY